MGSSSSGHTVIAIRQPWLSIMASIISAFMIGGFVFAWNVNAQQVKLEVLDEARLPERMVIIETKLESIQNTNERIEDKLDTIIEKEKDNGDSRTRNTLR